MTVFGGENNLRQQMSVVKQYDLGATLTKILEETAFPRLKGFVDDCLITDARRPWEMSRKTAALLTLVNISANCDWLPSQLKTFLGPTLTRLQGEIQTCLKEMASNPRFDGGNGPTESRSKADALFRDLQSIVDNRRTVGDYFMQEKVMMISEMLQRPM